MKNVPRLFIDEPLEAGKTFPLPAAQHHYLTHVMRTNKFLAFNSGVEYGSEITGNLAFRTASPTLHKDPGGDWTFCFAPIKRMEDLISGIVQMGAGVLQPVITERTTARHINWERMRKIIIESAEQSGRNSLPELRAPIPFADLDKSNLIYGDERKCEVWSMKREVGASGNSALKTSHSKLLIGPEGGFSDAEFAAFDAAGAAAVSLGRTILRAEVAAVALAAIWRHCE
jgi:16S rRNA (uracil1498-N3)-methyltransferase